MSRNPTETRDTHLIGEFNLSQHRNFDQNIPVGMWKMTYHEDHIDKKWRELNMLINKNELPLIDSIYCSTNVPNTLVQYPFYVIMCYVSNYNEKYVMDAGYSLLNKMKYGYFPFYYTLESQANSGRYTYAIDHPIIDQ